MEKHSFGPMARLSHVGKGNNESGCNPHVRPIHETSTYTFDTVEDGEDIFSGKKKKDAYGRISSPNFRDLEEGLCILEEGESAQVFDSGMSAIKVLTQSLLKSGDEIVAHHSLYGGTFLLFKDYLNFGITIKSVDTRNAMSVCEAVSSKTKMVYLETPSNPTLDICDFEEVKKLLLVAGYDDILVAVDNTFATPCNQRPLACGADVVIESLTKYINGYGNAIGGAFITSQEIMDRIWSRYNGSGGMIAPVVASRILNNMVSVYKRVAQHNINALNIAGYLQGHPMVSKVHYPGLVTHPNHDVAVRLMNKGYGGVVSFELKDEAKVRPFLNKLAQDRKDKEGGITLAISLGNVDTLICCPALSVHLKVPKAERLVQGITDGLIRLAVGTEEVDYIKYSLDRGFEAIT